MFGVVGGRFLKSWGDPAPEGDVAVSLGGGGWGRLTVSGEQEQRPGGE